MSDANSKKLDLTKPFRVRGKPDAKVRFVGKLEYSNTPQYLVFEVETPEAWSMVRVDECGRRFSGPQEHPFDIVNAAPERWRNVYYTKENKLFFGAFDYPRQEDARACEVNPDYVGTVKIESEEDND